MIPRLLLTACALLFSIVLQGRWYALFGWTAEFVFAMLIAALFFLDIHEYVFLVALAVLLMNWRPYVSIEIALLMVLPIIAFLSARTFPWRRGFTVGLWTVLGVFLFAIASTGTWTIAKDPLLWKDEGVSVLYASGLFLLFRALYETHRQRQFGALYGLPR